MLIILEHQLNLTQCWKHPIDVQLLAPSDVSTIKVQLDSSLYLANVDIWVTAFVLYQ